MDNVKQLNFEYENDEKNEKNIFMKKNNFIEIIFCNI